MGFDLLGKNKSYFGNQIYWWYPLWDYVGKNCNDILTSEDIQMGQYNEGHFISDSKAKRTAQRLRELRELGHTAEGGGEFTADNVSEFAEFCEKSGGFLII